MRIYQCGLIILNICTVSAGRTVCTQSLHFKYKLRTFIYEKKMRLVLSLTRQSTQKGNKIEKLHDFGWNLFVQNFNFRISWNLT